VPEADVRAALVAARARAATVRAETDVLRFQQRMAGGGGAGDDNDADDGGGGAGGDGGFLSDIEGDDEWGGAGALDMSMRTADALLGWPPSRDALEMVAAAGGATAQAAARGAPAPPPAARGGAPPAWFLPHAFSSLTLPPPTPVILSPGGRDGLRGLVPPVALSTAAAIEVRNRSRATLHFSLRGPGGDALPFLDVAPFSLGGGDDDGGGSARARAPAPALVGLLRNTGAAEGDGDIVVPPLSDGRVLVDVGLPRAGSARFAAVPPAALRVALRGWRWAPEARVLFGALALARTGGGAADDAVAVRVAVAERAWVALGWVYRADVHALEPAPHAPPAPSTHRESRAQSRTLSPPPLSPPLSSPLSPTLSHESPVVRRSGHARTAQKAPPARAPLDASLLSAGSILDATAVVPARAPAPPAAGAGADKPKRGENRGGAGDAPAPPARAPPTAAASAAASATDAPLPVSLAETALVFPRTRVGDVDAIKLEVRNRAPVPVVVDVCASYKGGEGAGGSADCAFFVRPAHARFVMRPSSYVLLPVRFRPAALAGARAFAAAAARDAGATLSVRGVLVCTFGAEPVGGLAPDTPVAALPGAVERVATLEGEVAENADA
jgi:hypothetical protein